MTLCEARGRFLFEVRPDALSDGALTDVEIALWAKWYDEREKRKKQN